MIKDDAPDATALGLLAAASGGIGRDTLRVVDPLLTATRKRYNVGREQSCMRSPTMDQSTIDGFWAGACLSVRSSAQRMAQQSRQEFGQLILNVAERFCSQATPTTKEELDFRQLQRISVSSICSGINHNETMASYTPGATQELYDLAKEFSERPLPTTKEECDKIALDRIANSGRASSICNKY